MFGTQQAQVASAAPTGLNACLDCDLLYVATPIVGGGTARCQRCNSVLYVEKPNTAARTLHLTLTSLILILLSNLFPFMWLSIAGRYQDMNLLAAIGGLYDQGFYFMAVLVLLASLVAPALRIGGLLYVLVPLRFGRVPPFRRYVGRFVQALTPWGMLDVFLLAAIVAMVKLADRAEVGVGIAFYAFIALIITSAAAASSLDTRLLWRDGAGKKK